MDNKVSKYLNMSADARRFIDQYQRFNDNKVLGVPTFKPQDFSAVKG